MDDRRKVAILGAGPGGLAAAFGLTATPALRARYEVTVFQLGWRAGGKCASGRAGPENRIEQNGTHYLFGCYDNTLAMAREAYAELDAAGVEGFGDFESALLPRDLLALKHRYRGEWRLWPVPLPVNRAEPGRRTGYLRAVDYLSMFLQSLACLLLGIRLGRALRPASPFDADRPALLRAIQAAARPVLTVLARLLAAVATVLLRLARGLMRALGDPDYLTLARLLAGLRALNRLAFAGLAGRFQAIYRVYTGLDFACTLGVALLRDRVPAEGLGAIEGVEFRAWLAGHGASETTLKAPFVATWYDAVAAYEDGDPERPNLSAGVSVMAIGKALLTYKGHFAYQMRAEVGDTFVAPVFECLRRRGVRFRFFHRVRDVIPGEGDAIEEIRLERQATLRCGDPDGYEPFVSPPGLDLKVWPNAPLWDQIVEAPPGPGVDLESFYTTWRGEAAPPLRRGEDFDDVVIAMPAPALADACPSLVARAPAWRALTEHMTGVESQTMRLYFDRSLEELGWTLPTPILSNYAMPFATWEDNGHLVEVETWPEGETPRAIATLFGPLPAPRVAPPAEDHGYPAAQGRRVDENALRFLEAHTGGLWPGVAAPGDPRALDWSALTDPGDRVGAARLAGQYLRANSGPLQRYTSARAGTAAHRPPSDDSGFSNLVLAGDWTRNGYLIGSVEGAIISGLQASRALCGAPAAIPGEDTGL